MALSTNSVWEVRPTVGSDTNGGGYVSGGGGTDYSQQNSKNSSGNNISTTDMVATGVATITSATASFTSAIVGNIIYISGSGLTTGWYQVTTYSNATTIILDRSPGTGTSGTMNIGGALATVLASLGTGIPFVGANTIWIKATGTMTVTASLLLEAFQTIVTTISGYTSTRGDGGQATWTTATNSTKLIQGGFNNLFFLVVNNIYFSNSAATRDDGFYTNGATVGYIVFNNCVFDGLKNGINGSLDASSASINGLYVLNCEIKNCTNNGIWNANNTYVSGCYIHSNTNAGFKVGSNQQSLYIIERTACYNNQYGIYIIDDQNKAFVINNCSIYTNGSHGLFRDTSGGDGNSMVSIWNNVFYGNGGYGIDWTSTITGIFDVRNNAFGSNTSGNRGSFPYGSTSDLTLTVDPFTAGSSDNFTLNGSSGGGAVVKAAGFQGTLNGATNTNQGLDVGAVQSTNTGGTGGGGGGIVLPEWAGGFNG